jgi:hypothetical protein
MRAWLTLAWCVGSAWAQQAIVLDFSHSMAGFASSQNNRLAGVLQRLSRTLKTNGAVSHYAMMQPPGGAPTIEAVSLEDAAQRFSKESRFRGGTPLLWALTETITTKKATEIVFLTDGMEEGGEVDRVAAELARLMDANWAMGIAAVDLPFAGTYYTEQTVPLDQTFWPRIEQAVRARNTNWKVAKVPCASANSSCYRFEGERPLVALLLSKSGQLDRLFDAWQRALEEMSLPAQRKVRLGPVQARPVTVTLTAPKQTTAVMKLPRTPAEPLFCAVPQNQRVELTVQMNVAGASGADEPSAPRPGAPQVKERANWLSQAGELKAANDALFEHRLMLLCAKGSFSFSGSGDVAGRVKLEYPVSRPAVRGWWTDLSADNSWEQPFKVYKLREVVEQVHARALAKARLDPVRVDLSMRSQN